MLNEIVSRAPDFLLVAVRCFMLMMTLPLLATEIVPRVAKIALAGYAAFLVLPSAYVQGWDVDPFSLHYVLLLIGEGLIGVITGFYISMLFAAFSSAGQFFTYQMGFGASEVYDALSQVSNPLMGQYLNFIALILFLQTQGFQKLFLGGILRSFQTLNSFTLVTYRENFMDFLLDGLTKLFFDAMVIALPIVGTLFLVSVCMGILSKAAPQMNLLSEGLPITILVAFFFLTILLPYMADFFINLFEVSFIRLERLLIDVGVSIP
ncbi:MAG: flagellar biosynthetic protein FliR [Spirochaetales bacterium]